MKSTVSLKSVAYASVLSMIFFLVGCNSQPTEYDLLGKWKMVNVESGNNIGNIAIAIGLSAMNDPVFEFKASREISVTNADGSASVAFNHNLRMKDGKIVSVKENGLENQLFAVDLRNDTLYLMGSKGFNLTLTRLQ